MGCFLICKMGIIAVSTPRTPAGSQCDKAGKLLRQQSRVINVNIPLCCAEFALQDVQIIPHPYPLSTLKIYSLQEGPRNRTAGHKGSRSFPSSSQERQNPGFRCHFVFWGRTLSLAIHSFNGYEFRKLPAQNKDSSHLLGPPGITLRRQFCSVNLEQGFRSRCGQERSIADGWS